MSADKTLKRKTHVVTERPPFECIALILQGGGALGGEHNVRANVLFPGFARTPLVDKQIPEQAKELGISEQDVIKHLMSKDTVDGEFTTTEDIADAVQFFAAHGATR